MGGQEEGGDGGGIYLIDLVNDLFIKSEFCLVGWLVLFITINLDPPPLHTHTQSP